jgi:hypothetical protein
MRRLVPLLISVVLIGLFAAPAQAAPDFCFPQVPDCITGRFASYWRDGGGLAVFGLPLTPSKKEQVGDQSYRVQYFERARFELHPELQRPYDVLLGRIGVDQLAAHGRDWATFAKGDPAAAHFFVETGHTIAPQFWGFWSTHGLEFDGNKKAISVPEAIALFGLPVSEAQMENGEDGNMYLTQWFERARFEYHPENQLPYDVLLGRLGAELVAQQQVPPSPPPTPQGLPGIPAPTGDCSANAPPAAEGAQAWMTVPEPATINQFDSICARLIVNGAVVSGADVIAVAHYHNKSVTFGKVSTGQDGVAEIGFKIGDEHLALRHLQVNVDVTITTRDEHTYTAQTQFTPVYPRPQ